MKVFRSALLVLVIVALLVSLSGCIVVPLPDKYYDIPADKVESIQFYDLRVPGVDNTEDFYMIYDPVYILPEAETEKFLCDFSKLVFSDSLLITIAAVDPSFSYGDWVVRINFSNGNYTFYSCDGYGATFDADGKWLNDTHYSCEKEDLEHLISKYYPIDSPQE